MTSLSNSIRHPHFSVFAELDDFAKWPGMTATECAEKYPTTVEGAQQIIDDWCADIADQRTWVTENRTLLEASAPAWAWTVGAVDTDANTFIYSASGDIVQVFLPGEIYDGPHPRVALAADGPTLTIELRGPATLEAIEKIITELRVLADCLPEPSLPLHSPSPVDVAGITLGTEAQQ